MPEIRKIFFMCSFRGHAHIEKYECKTLYGDILTKERLQRTVLFF